MDNNQAILQYQILKETFESNSKVKMNAENILSNDYNSDVYSKSYCGAYMNDDDTLSIMLRDDSDFQYYADKMDGSSIQYLHSNTQ